MKPIEVDVWVRGTLHATTHMIPAVSPQAESWTDADVHRLLTEMLRAIEREKNPTGEPPPVTLRGFSWIVSPFEAGGVVVHLEMQMGTASAGPFQIDQERLTTMIGRAMQQPVLSSSSIH
jgi:hypothetical protein